MIGRKLCKYLRNLNDHELFFLSRDKNGGANIKGNLGDPRSLLSACQNINVIVHLAGITHSHDAELYYDINTRGTENLLRAADAGKVGHFIYISSRAASVDGGAYAHSKLLAEKKVREYPGGWTILSPAEVYGAGPEEMISRLISLVRKYPIVPVPGGGKYVLRPVFVDDVVGAIASSIGNKKTAGQKYIIAGPQGLALAEVIEIIAQALGKKVYKIRVPVPLLKIAACIFPLLKIKLMTKDQIQRLICPKPSDIEPARRDLRFKPLSFPEGLKKILGPGP